MLPNVLQPLQQTNVKICKDLKLLKQMNLTMFTPRLRAIGPLPHRGPGSGSQACEAEMVLASEYPCNKNP